MCACCKLLAAFRVALVLERNNAVELKPSMEDMLDAVRKVCEDIIAITENLPRLALPGTARQLKELEVGCQAEQPASTAYGQCIAKSCHSRHVLRRALPAGRQSSLPPNQQGFFLLAAGTWAVTPTGPRQLLPCHQG